MSLGSINPEITMNLITVTITGIITITGLFISNKLALNKFKSELLEKEKQVRYYDFSIPLFKILSKSTIGIGYSNMRLSNTIDEFLNLIEENLDKLQPSSLNLWLEYQYYLFEYDTIASANINDSNLETTVLANIETKHKELIMQLLQETDHISELLDKPKLGKTFHDFYNKKKDDSSSVLK
ncbi:hypothetical protein [Mammaliicoccus sciuri]|uniref:hypothetical protein n=1 Tax=Mammaliicoccus sciuri TaxID=1296 RepID=UPI000D1F5E57|nr:hypothetical protein [Mammaliicoccus sciuri]MCD8898356.1 hypothetical protein [Mammaliicoccus sciuri]PTK16736.1 hypothetical protein BUZ90_02780 [Mammaliicoccus sciuri]